MYILRSYPRMMHITNSDFHAIYADGRWELYDNTHLFDYADNQPIATAKLRDAFEAAYAVSIDEDTP